MSDEIKNNIDEHVETHNTTSKSITKKMLITKMLKKWILNCVACCAFTLSAVLGSSLLLTSFLLFTHTGNQGVIKVVKQFESRLSVDLLEGSLLRSPSFANIAWIDGETNVLISRVDYQFDWSCLAGSLCLTSLHVDGVQVALPEAVNSSEAKVESAESTPVAIDIPIEIRIADISVSDLYFEQGELSVELDNLSLQADAYGNDVSLATQIAGVLVTLPDAASTVPTKTVAPKQEKQRKDLHFDSLPALITQEMLPRISLPINLNVAPIQIDNLKVVQNEQRLFELNSLATAFTFTETTLEISQFALNLPETDLNLNASIDFIEDYPLAISIEGALKEIKQLEPATLVSGLNYSLKSSGRLSDLSSELNLSNNINLQLRAHLDLLADNLPHKLTLDWQALQWPLTGEAQYRANAGSFTSQGSLSDYDIALNGDYHVADIPRGVISLTTKGDLQQLQIESLKIETLSGDVDFSGLLSWQDRIDWLGKLTVNNIDLAELETEYDGHFSGVIAQQVAVTLYDNGAPDWQFSFPELNIDGELLSRPLSVNGKVTGDDKQGIVFDALTIDNAQNRLIVDGRLAAQNDLDINLNIADLSHLLLDAKGAIKGRVQLQGAVESLLVNSQLAAQQLVYQDYLIEQVDLDGTLILTDKPQLTLDLSAKKISDGNQLIDDVSLLVSNNPSTIIDNTEQSTTKQPSAQTYFRHQVDLAVHSELVASEMMLFITQTNDELLAQLNNAKVDVQQQTLTLLSPIDINAQEKQIDMSAHCWQANTDTISDAGKVCIKQFNAGESGDVVVEIDQYQLAILNRFFPQTLQIAGGLSANAAIQWQKEHQPSFKVNLLSDDMLLKIKQDNESEKFTSYPMQALNISLQGSEEVVDVDANIFAEKLLDIRLTGQLQPYLTQPLVDATLISSLPDFSLFLPLVPAFDALQGQLNSELAISGNLNKPTLNGEITILHGGINSADLPIKISELQALIKVDKNSANLQASFDSSDANTLGEKTARLALISKTIGLLDNSVKKISSTLLDPLIEQPEIKQEVIKNPGLAIIEGNVDWSQQLTGDIHFYAHQLEVYDYGKLDLLINPDINLLFNEHVKVDGTLSVDRGKVVVQELPEGAVSQSADIVVVDIDTETAEKELPIIIDLEVDTGSDLQIIALGLDTFMEGKLSIQKQFDRDLTINGVLALSDGSYRSLGQQLVLQDSRIIFQGAPESPYVQIEAIRDTSKIEDDVIAGVRVTGTPDELELVIFSEPAMAQQEALSYLTRGQGIDSTSEGGTMANLLIDVAAGQSGGVMSSIGEEVGIKDLSLDSSGSGDEQSVGISGEIADGVELSYGVGVFESFSVISLRYELFERFYIEASSGISQAVDAYYEWDWD